MAEKMFIDTNFFLNLYESKNEAQIEKIYEDILKIKMKIVLTDQVYDEFLRNRDKKLNGLLTTIQENNSIKIFNSPLVSNLDEYKKLINLKKDFDKNKNNLIKKIKEMKENPEKDIVYQHFIKMFNDPHIIKFEKNKEIIKRAYKRKMLGNPPGNNKQGTMGDEVIWETLLENLNDNLVVISNDGTYELYNSFLKNEFKREVKKEFRITNSLAIEIDKIGTSTKELKEFEKNIDKTFNEWKILRKEGNIAYVTDGKRGGYTPINKTDTSYMCPTCGKYGPWNGVICLSCGSQSYPE
jgi:rRNA-processing protein FCF1